ncbi:MAG: hypothetical protein WCH46_09710 [bacterium]
MNRAFHKKGFNISPGNREPIGIFRNQIVLSDGSGLILETTSSHDPTDWRNFMLRGLGNIISGMTFEVGNIDTLYYYLINSGVAVTTPQKIININTSNTTSKYYFALDSCFPLDVIFMQKDSSNNNPIANDSLKYHPNHVFRIDWVLLSASLENEIRLRQLFQVIGALKLHEGCCDFWRVGPSDDFCFFRFEPVPARAKGATQWLSIEAENIYFAY